MLMIARASKTVAAALPESRRGRSSSSGGNARAAASIASTANGGGRQQRRRRETLRPPPPTPSLLRAASSAAAAAAASSETPAPLAPTAIQTKLGPLTVRPLAEADVTAAAVVLTRAFTANGSSPPLADVEEWLSAALDKASSETAVLVGELVPEDRELLAPGKKYRVAGVAAVALSAAAAAAAVGTGGGDNSSARPLSFPLLCNVAVDPRLRRLGIGRALVSAAEDVAKQGNGGEGGFSSLFVVARGSEDAAAEKLYSSLGFVADESREEKGGGNFFSSLFGNKASAEKLMKKELM